MGQRIILVILSLFSLTPTQAQQALLDSLGEVYARTENSDSLRASAALRAGTLLTQSAKFDSAVSVFKSAAKTAGGEHFKIQNKAHKNISIAFYYAGNYDKSHEAALEALKLMEISGDMAGIPKMYNILGAIMTAKGDGKKSSEYLMSAIELAKAQNDSTTLMQAGGNLGNTLKESGDWEGMLKYARMTLQIALQKNSFRAIVQSYMNISDYYSHDSNLDSARLYLQYAEKLSREKGDFIVLGKVLNNLGENYLTAKDYKKAQEVLAEAAPILKRVSKPDWAVLVQNLSSCYANNGEVKQALALLNEVMQLDEEYLTLNIKEGIARAYFKAYQTAGRYDSAVFYLQKSVLYKDSLQKMNNIEVIANLEKKYETKKKEERIQHLEDTEALRNETIRKQNQLIYTSVAALLLVLASLAFSVRAGVQRKRANEELEKKNREVVAKSESLTLANAEINQQKEEIQAQADNLLEVNKEVMNKNRSITDSIRYAQSIQEAILPHIPRLKASLQDAFVLYRPQHIVSGDFFWFEEFEDYQLLAVGDCTGHGVPGAFMSLLGMTFLSEAAKEKTSNYPAEMLEQINRQVTLSLKQEETGNEDGMELIICRLEPSQIIFSASKRPLFVVDANSSLVEYKGTRRYIGKTKASRQNDSFVEHKIPRVESNMLYLSSDGFQDQPNPKRKKFGSPKLKALLEDVAPLPATEQKQQLAQALDEHQGEAWQVDDITVLGVRL